MAVFEAEGRFLPVLAARWEVADCVVVEILVPDRQNRARTLQPTCQLPQRSLHSLNHLGFRLALGLSEGR